jgi:hypothetical protein
MGSSRRWRRVAGAVTALVASASVASSGAAATVGSEPTFASPPLDLRVDHARLRVDDRIQLHFTVTSVGVGMPGAAIRIAGHHLKTDLSGRATISLRPVRTGVLDAVARYPGSVPTIDVLIVSR